MPRAANGVSHQNPNQDEIMRESEKRPQHTGNERLHGTNQFPERLGTPENHESIVNQIEVDRWERLALRLKRLIDDEVWERITLRLTRIAAATLRKHNLSTETAPDVAQEIILGLLEGKIGAGFVEQLLEELAPVEDLEPVQEGVEITTLIEDEEQSAQKAMEEAEIRLVRYLSTVAVRRVYKRLRMGTRFITKDFGDEMAPEKRRDIRGVNVAENYASEDLINQYLQDYEDDEVAHDILVAIARDGFERRKDIAVHLGLTEAQVHAAFKRIRRRRRNR